jgi:hypothetical protein
MATAGCRRRKSSRHALTPSESSTARTRACARRAKRDQDQPIGIPRYQVRKAADSSTRQGDLRNWHEQASDGGSFGKGARHMCSLYVPVKAAMPIEETGRPVTPFQSKCLRRVSGRRTLGCGLIRLVTGSRLPPSACGDAERSQRCLPARRARKTPFSLPPAVPAIRPATSR